jgi:tRNA (guanine-N7-)-methyltransferase
MQLNSVVPSHFINPYISLMDIQSEWVFEQESAQLLKSQWQKKVFQSSQPLHVEIGTGNGFHFAHYAETNPEVCFLGFEIKFKTTVQSIERARGLGATNARMIKGDARKLTNYFADREVQKIMIHFPDPWPKRRQQKNRLMSSLFLKEMEQVLSPGGVVEFKTDHFGYFKHATRCAAESNLTLEFYTEDLHHSFISESNYVTLFEGFFLRKSQPIYSFILRKN